MQSYFGTSESLECQTAGVVALKIETCGRALNHHIIGRCLKYICTRNGFAEIRKELSPKESLLKNPNAKLTLGDNIQAESFYVLVKGIRKECIEFNGKFSGRHNCNTFTSSSDYAYAEIRVPFPGKDALPVSIHEKFVSPLAELSKKKIQ